MSILSFIAIISTIIYSNVESPKIAHFSVSECFNNSEELMESFRERIIDSTFEQSQFKIKVAVIANCGIGSYYDVDLNQDTLILKYGIAEGFAGYFCNCQFNLDYTITQLEPKAYHVKIENHYNGINQKLINRSPYKFVSQIYPDGLNENEYRTQFLQKYEGLKKLLEDFHTILKSINTEVDFAKNSGNNLNYKIERLSVIGKLYKDERSKFSDPFIKEILGNEIVFSKENILSDIEKEIGKLIEELKSKGIRIQ